MKTIGIKLADGTFYPILEEGTPKKRMLDLTTAKDNQTKVQIDLYRSENGTMEDAEYVDTLEVTKLNPHPNGEPELHLSVGLDENNNLTAEVVDPETGKKSETEVNLVSRTEAERAAPSDFAIADSENIVDTASEETTYSSDDLPELGATALEDMPFSFDSSSPSDSSVSEDETIAADGIDGSVPDFSGLDDLPVEDTTLEGIDFSSESLGDDTVTDEIGTESPDLGGDIQTDTTSISDETVAGDDMPDFSGISDDTDLPDFGDTSNETVSSEDSFADDSLPDFGDDTTLPDFGDTNLSDSGDTSSDPSLDEFTVPDFDELAAGAKSSGAETTGLDFDDLNDPAFSSSEFDSSFDSLDTPSTGGAMDFSDLYDKETLAGEHASLYDEEEEEKKTHTPMIICIICAIICVIAVILLLFIVPSKYNLLASRNTNGVSILDKFFKKDTAVEKVVEEQPKEETEYIDVVVEEPKNEPAPEAQEDKIIIAPEPEKVVPKPVVEEPKKPEVKKTSDVKYHIRWGDTLWDLSESYYKTPWKYPKIADYNHIKNPDLIISGTDILIPAE